MREMNTDVPNAKLYGQAKLFERVNRTVAPGDSMFKSCERYFSVGASALSAVLELSP